MKNKESNALTLKVKNKCWSKFSELYNSTTTGCVSVAYYLFYDDDDRKFI